MEINKFPTMHTGTNSQVHIFNCSSIIPSSSFIHSLNTPHSSSPCIHTCCKQPVQNNSLIHSLTNQASSCLNTWGIHFFEAQQQTQPTSRWWHPASQARGRWIARLFSPAHQWVWTQNLFQGPRVPDKGYTTEPSPLGLGEIFRGLEPIVMYKDKLPIKEQYM